MRHPDLRVAVLPRVEVEHELGQRALEARRRAPQDREPRLRHLRRAREVEEARRLAELAVGPGEEAERAGRSPAAHLDVLRLGGPGRHRRVGEVRDLEEHALELSVHPLELGLERLDALADLTHPRHLRRRVLATPLRLADRLRGAVLEGLELLALFDETTAGGVEVEHALYQLRTAPVGEPRSEERRVGKGGRSRW